MYVFVYGSLKKDFHNEQWLFDAVYVGTGITKFSDYHMISFDQFSGVIYGNNYIFGELYEIDDEMLKQLDKLESNGSFYQREETIIRCNNKEIVAWMYILIDDYSDLLGPEDDVENEVLGWHNSKQVYIM